MQIATVGGRLSDMSDGRTHGGADENNDGGHGGCYRTGPPLQMMRAKQNNNESRSRSINSNSDSSSCDNHSH